MPVPTDPYNFTNGTIADADQVDARFAPLYGALNNGLDATNLTTATENTWLKLDSVANRKVKWGTVTIPGFADTNTRSGTVTHGLGATPLMVIATAEIIGVFSGPPSGNSSIAMAAYALNSTTFSWYATIASGLSSQGSQFYWLAIA